MRNRIPKEEIIGKRFSKLIVVGLEFKPYKRYKCLCDCGNFGFATQFMLTSGKAKSCGCYRISHAKIEPGLSGFNDLIKRYRHDAKERSLEFLLTNEQFKILTKSNCYYCNSSPERVIGISNNAKYTYNGIDRKDNNIGYLIDNVVTCCTFCNYAKHIRSHDEFINWLNNLVKYRSSLSGPS